MTARPFCAICTADIAPGSEPIRRPLGHNGGMVRVCASCDGLHPRSGRYGFDDGAAGSGVGDGNTRYSVGNGHVGTRGHVR